MWRDVLYGLWTALAIRGLWLLVTVAILHNTGDAWLGIEIAALLTPAWLAFVVFPLGRKVKARERA